MSISALYKLGKLGYKVSQTTPVKKHKDADKRTKVAMILLSPLFAVFVVSAGYNIINAVVDTQPVQTINY